MANKLLLLDDVDSLGRTGDIVSVKPGYARNFLLPQGLAVIADKHALRMQTRLQEERRQRAVVDRKDAEEIASKLENVTISTVVKVDHDGHMYGSVSAGDIVRLLEEQVKVTLEKRSIHLKHAIKETGVHPIEVRLKEGITSSFTLKIMSEEVNESILAEKSEPSES